MSSKTRNLKLLEPLPCGFRNYLYSNSHDTKLKIIMCIKTHKDIQRVTLSVQMTRHKHIVIWVVLCVIEQAAGGDISKYFSCSRSAQNNDHLVGSLFLYNLIWSFSSQLQSQASKEWRI